MRLDISLQKMGLTSSRQKAKELIKQGHISVNGSICFKPSYLIKDGDDIKIIGETLKYVGRGGLKLEKIIDICRVDLNNKICMDIGASTGGFTDCMLQNGASKVYAIDVGYGQFAWKLRNDERVVCLEKTNVRYVTHEQVPDEGDFASIDVSFISLTKVLPAVLGVLGEKGQLVCLIKPQFEAGREKVGKKGVVRDSSVHREVIEMIVEYVRTQSLGILGLDFSPIKGPEGNIEYLIYLDKSRSGMHEDEVQARVDTVVAQSHKILSGEK